MPRFTSGLPIGPELIHKNSASPLPVAICRREPLTLIRDAVFAIALALIVVGAGELIAGLLQTVAAP